MIFASQEIIYPQAGISVNAEDSGSPSITYSEIKQSFGQQAYLVKGLYLYSDNLNQLTGAIKYIRYDANGNQIVTNITTIIDPNQKAKSLFVDLQNFESDIIFNGNTYLSFDVLPETEIQVKFYTNRVTNQFGKNLNNFVEMERIARKPNFFKGYGDIPEIEETNEEIKKTASLYKNVEGQEVKSDEIAVEKRKVVIPVFGNATLSLGLYLLLRKK